MADAVLEGKAGMATTVPTEVIESKTAGEIEAATGKAPEAPVAGDTHVFTPGDEA